MALARVQAPTSVERFFQFSLLGLISSGCCALAATGLPDRATLTLTFIGLIVRAAMVAGLLRIEIPANVVSITAFACAAFWRPSVTLAVLDNQF